MSQRKVFPKASIESISKIGDKIQITIDGKEHTYQGKNAKRMGENFLLDGTYITKKDSRKISNNLFGVFADQESSARTLINKSAQDGFKTNMDKFGNITFSRRN